MAVRDKTKVMEKKWPDRKLRRVVILGSGFAGIEVLKTLQKGFHNDDSALDITLISKDNFLLFTPMLPEVSSGMIETRHIVTPVRSFLKGARFYQANVESIDLEKKKVVVSHAIGKEELKPSEWKEHTIEYDYLVIALGSETNFFGLQDVKQHFFTMVDIDDAIKLRNHIINVLEQASLEQADITLRKKLLTFIVVGGGFNGIETVGEMNDFVRNTVKKFYKNISVHEIRMVLVHASGKILEQIDEELGKYALKELKKRGIDFILNTNVNGATETSAKLDKGDVIPSYTMVWSAGVTPSKLISNLACPHDKKHRIMVNEYLEVQNYEGSVYAVGDCASLTNPNTGKPYPPTAQHALKEAKTAAKNITHEIEGQRGKKKKFAYKTRGMMAEIGSRNGVALVFGFKFHGFIAWWLWRTFYLANLPIAKKKLKVISDWTMDLFYKPDVSMIKRSQRKEMFAEAKSEEREEDVHTKFL